MAPSLGLAAYRALAFLVHRTPLPTGPVASSVAGRRGATARWIAWAATRPPGPLIWIHGASVGELLTATPIVPRLLQALPDAQFMYTHSSPSAVGWTIAGAARVDFVPLDEPGPIRRALVALEPRLLVYSCGDVWPELTARACRTGTPVAVVGGRARPTSLRSTAAGHVVYRRLYRKLAWVGARSQEDAERWMRAGVPAGHVTVTGDPRHDYAIERVPELHEVAPILDWAAGRRVLVAGSTNAADERVLVRAALRVLRGHADRRLLIVPHTPTDQYVHDLLAACRAGGLSCTSWRSGEPTPKGPVVVVRQTGLLFDLYAAGTVAYVGGGFRRGRVHAVIEPATWALPVIAGPKADDDRDVRLLVDRGAAATLPHADPEAAMAELWTKWCDESVVAGIGPSARSALESGAATRTAQALVALIGG